MFRIPYIRRFVALLCIVLLVYISWIYVRISVLQFFKLTGDRKQEKDNKLVKNIRRFTGRPKYLLKDELSQTFYRFVNPETHNIHRNATWFALSLLSESLEKIHPAVRNQQLEDKLSMQLQQENISIEMGGYYSPNDQNDWTNCSVINRTLVILVPYRNRARNLIQFLSFMHRYLPLKSVSYRVVVLEQTDVKPFNRAKLFNAGLRELGVLIDEGKRPFVEDDGTRNNCTNQCFILHDVDKLPASMQAPYECHKNPWQLYRIAVTFNQWTESQYILYDTFFGGVTMVNRRAVLLTNGLSNTFYGWGGEDDDFRSRMRLLNIPVDLAPLSYSRYYNLSHANRTPHNKQVLTLLSSIRVNQRMKGDGIRQVQYTVRDRIERPLYTLYKLAI